MEQTPYGAWPSPLSADLVAGATVRLSWPALVDGAVWWAESRPAEAGRTAVVRRDADGTVADVLPAPWDARTRVHEYGGRSWIVVDGALVFAAYADQRLYRLAPGGEPTPLTPEPDEPAGARYAELLVVGAEIWCVRELHRAGTVSRALVAVPTDGSQRLRVLHTGTDFLAHPRMSPDGTALCWLGWDHPQMPWDGTTLWTAPVEAGGLGPVRALLGGPTEAVLQPEWRADGSLTALTDRSGWWNLVLVDAEGAVTPLHPAAEEFGGALWELGRCWYAPLDDGRLVVTHGGRLGVLGTGGELRDLDLPYAGFGMLHTDGRDVVAVAVSTDAPPSVVRLRADGSLEVVHAAGVPPVGPEWFAVPQRRTFPGVGGRVVHALVSPPTSPVASGPEGGRPPYVVFVHGGPTAAAGPGYDLDKTYFTSRGIGVLDVDYGGSTGYGRVYRDALRGQWGVVDVEDCVAAARALAAAGEADPDRLLIRGGSAGGWTVLAALTGTDAFAAGASYYGVADLIPFATDTHDFESRYLDGLIGPLPAAEALYVERSPLTHVDGLSCPVLLLQGADDRVVPPSQAEVFRDALAAKGLPHAYLLFAGEAHGFRTQANIATALEAEVSFYGQVLGVTPPEIPLLTLVTGA